MNKIKIRLFYMHIIIFFHYLIITQNSLSDILPSLSSSNKLNKSNASTLLTFSNLFNKYSKSLISI